MPGRYGRRELLRRGAGLALASGAVGLVPVTASAGRPGVTALRQLARRLRGGLVVRGSSGFGPAGAGWNTRFDDIEPLAIAFCESVADVQACVRWAVEHGVRPRPRSGRHSYAGYSTGPGALVVDVGRLRSIRVDPAAGTATIGAGADVIESYAALARHGVAVPIGSCPSVGLAGLTLGGGLGLASRKLGLTIDQLLEVELVTAAGTVVRADRRRRPELFWACRGGGGGNFGVVTRMRFRTQPVGDVAVFQLAWPLERAPAVVDAWQRLMPGSPDELFSICRVVAAPTAPGSPPARQVRCFGQLLGSETRLRRLIAPLLAIDGRTTTDVESLGYLAAQQLWAGCENDLDACRDPRTGPQPGPLTPFPFHNKSDILRRRLSSRAIETMVDWVARWPGARVTTSPPAQGAIQLDSWGGAINRPASDATAFVHRDALFSAQYLASWAASDSAATGVAVQRWVRGFHTAMRPFVSGFAYQNYVDPDLRDWPHAYHGENFERLVRVKTAYDPRELFRFPQGIPARRGGFTG